MSDWKTYTLGKVTNIKNGKSRPKEMGIYPVYGGNGILGYTNKFNSDDESTIIGRVGAYCGSVYFENREIWISDNALVVKTNNKGNANFIFYWLKNKNLNQFASGSSQPLLTQGFLNEIEINLPDLATQTQIAQILSSLDDKIGLNLQMNQTLEAIAQAIFKEWFVDFKFPGFDGELVDGFPKGWRMGLFEDISTLFTGGDKPKDFSELETEEFNVPIYSNGISNEGLYGFTNSTKINEESVTVSARGTIGYVRLNCNFTFTE